MHLLTTLSTRSIHCMFGEATSFVGQKVTRDHVSCLLFFVFSFSIENFPCTRSQTTNRTKFYLTICVVKWSFPPPFWKERLWHRWYWGRVIESKGQGLYFSFRNISPKCYILPVHIGADYPERMWSDPGHGNESD